MPAREKPILMSGPMVRAILDGRKTQTRRIIKPVLGAQASWCKWEAEDTYKANGLTADIPVEARARILYCPFLVGMKLWVKESLEAYNLDLGGKLGLSDPVAKLDMTRGDVAARYVADKEPAIEGHGFDLVWKWKRKSLPSIHMPRDFSRITLEITGVRVERLQEISQEDARAEGCRDYSGDPREEGGPSPIECYRRLWELINGVGSWKNNSWVWCISFRRLNNEPNKEAA